MVELVIQGRGGQGGVTLAKLIATAYFLRGKHAQAFGVYAAERSGAPVQAFVRIDDEEIVNHNQVRTPDHVIVLDRTLIGPGILRGLSADGWIILNTADPPAAFSDRFPGRRVATVDATSIASASGLGTRTVPIVNTTMFGAVACVLGLDRDAVEAALADVHLSGPNVSSARLAFEAVRSVRLPGEPSIPEVTAAPAGCASLLDENVGQPPRIRTGSWANRRPLRRALTPPCNHNCPAGNDVQSFVQLAAAGDYDAALDVLMRTSPLPGVRGRVCPAPCMTDCNRRLFDEAVNVRDLERYVADHGRPPDLSKPWRPETVAIIGSGPAGLSAAYQLARLGYPVTLFEAGHELGGLLRTGIPEYRLPRDVLDREISHILRHGVSVECGQRVTRRRLVELTRRFGAVFVGTGLQELRGLDLGPAAEGVVEQGLEFLERARLGAERLSGQRVVVIGGGNTAFDAARSARRLGARSVRILYRRSRAEMPAIGEEIEDALAEGVVLDELVAPLHVRRNGDGSLLTCVRMRLGEPDESGRARPIPDTSEDACFDVACDRVILAAGQSADLSVLPEGASIYEKGEPGKGEQGADAVVRSSASLCGLTGAPVFLGGDLATNDGTVAAAIGSGYRAALHIHRTLSGEELVDSPSEPVADPSVIAMHAFAHAGQERGVVLAPGSRRDSFAEVRRGLFDEPGRHAAVLEAQRCFSCGVCNQCDACLTHCPEGILRRDGDGYRFDYDYCKGCGVCASACPRGVIYMAEL